MKPENMVRFLLAVSLLLNIFQAGMLVWMKAMLTAH